MNITEQVMSYARFFFCLFCLSLMQSVFRIHSKLDVLNMRRGIGNEDLLRNSLCDEGGIIASSQVN